MQQVLVPDRNLFGDATFDVFGPIIDRKNGGLLAPIREAGTFAHSVVDDGAPNSAQLVVDDLRIAPIEFGPPTIEDIIDANS